MTQTRITTTEIVVVTAPCVVCDGDDTTGVGAGVDAGDTGITPDTGTSAELGAGIGVDADVGAGVDAEDTGIAPDTGTGAELDAGIGVDADIGAGTSAGPAIGDIGGSLPHVLTPGHAPQKHNPSDG